MGHYGVGFSASADAYGAGMEATKEALEAYGGTKPGFVLLFSTHELPPEELLAGVQEVIGNVPMLGCCAPGVLTHRGVGGSGVAVMVGGDENLSVSFGLGRAISEDPHRAGVEAASITSGLVPSSSHALLFLLHDGTRRSNLVELVKGAYSVFGSKVRYVGGGATDIDRFQRTYQLIGQDLYEDTVVSALFSFPRPPVVGMRHGWKPFGPPILVTRAEGHIVHELDGRPALEAYQEICGVQTLSTELGPFAMASPLGIPHFGGRYIIRDPLRIVSGTSLLCSAEVPPHSVVRIMQGDRTTVLTAIEEAAVEAFSQTEGRRVLGAVIVYCFSQIRLLGKERADESLEAVRRVIGKEVPLIGFWSAGEIGNLTGGPPAFHNKTIVIWLLTD